MTLRENLISVADSYCSLTGLSKARVSTLVLSGGRRLAVIEAGGDIGTEGYERAMQWFSDRWPEEAEWPEGIPRPERSIAEAAE
ncbi:MAG TPA: hypothetical protein VGN93_31240 [Shinella sp.]|jgi:hypothetical protein|uniref:hypothetical protein n=1 Tax=Shinella sp. TaxID=1870904 RepID=UPI002E0F50B4|nr:hypothetical protein [Shinella sp.]